MVVFGGDGGGGLGSPCLKFVFSFNEPGLSHIPVTFLSYYLLDIPPSLLHEQIVEKREKERERIKTR